MAGARAELSRAGAELRERGLQLERRRERLVDELAQTRAESASLAEARARLDVTRRQTGVQLSLLTAELGDVEAERAAVEHLRAEAQEAVAELRVSVAAKESALEALDRLERDREGYGAGVRAIFSDGATAQLAGVVGTVADLLEVPPGLEMAVEAVLGDRLQWIVVERFEHARAALGYLGSEDAGAATLLPLETLPSPAALPDDSSELHWAARLVTGPRPELLSYLLGRVGLVPHLDLAEVLWRRNGVVATYVTPSGEVLSPTGRLSGGRRDSERHGNDQSILGRKRAIRQLAEELAGRRQEVEAAGRRLEELDAAVRDLRTREGMLRSSRQAKEAARLADDKDVESAQREEERVRRHLETLSVENEQIDEERAEAGGRLAEVEVELGAAQARESTLDLELGELSAALDADREAEGALVADVTACRVELATVSERVQALARDIDRLGELEREYGVQLDEAVRRRAQLAERREELGRERERTDALAREAAAERDRREAEVSDVAETHRGQVAAREGVEIDLGQAQRDLNALVSRLHELDLKETEGRVRREELFQEARRRHAVESAEALAGAHDPGRDQAEIRARHDELAGKLEAMGPVNLVADEEYRELEERLDFLRTQHDDVVASIKDLEKALKGMTRTAQERFEEAFAEINRHFAGIFSRLFEGGRAELRMVPPEEGEDDPLELGVELMAQPRGKRLQAVTLMSGGEKALTGPGAALRDLLLPAEPLLRARRGRRAARRRQYSPLSAGPARAHLTDPVHRDHPQQEDDGRRRRALRRHHGGAGVEPPRLGQVDRVVTSPTS